MNPFFFHYSSRELNVFLPKRDHTLFDEERLESRRYHRRAAWRKRASTLSGIWTALVSWEQRLIHHRPQPLARAHIKHPNVRNRIQK